MQALSSGNRAGNTNLIDGLVRTPTICQSDKLIVRLTAFELCWSCVTTQIIVLVRYNYDYKS